MTPPLSIWIVNYNSVVRLAACLPGLRSPSIDRIVVLDNASSPGDRSALRDLAAQDNRIMVIFSDENLGFGAGHNRIAACTEQAARPEDLIWILNPDTVVEPESVDDLCQIISDGGVDILSPTIVTGTAISPVIWFAGGKIDVRRGRTRHLNAGRRPGTNPAARLTPTDFITGAAPMMTRSTWDRLGGFRNDLFLYWEDVDLSLRAKSLGVRMAVAGRITIWHAEGGSSPSETGTSPIAYYYSARNRIIVCAQFGNAVGLMLGRGFSSFLEMAATAFLKGRGGRWTRLWAVVSGTVDGVRGRTGVAGRKS